MEAASRPSLELLSDLPVEAPLDAAAARGASPPAPKAAAPAQASTPAGSPAPKDPSQTGITFLDPAALVLEGAPAEAVAAPAPAPSAPPSAGDLELVLEDPAVVEELLTSPPPPPPKAPAVLQADAPTLTPAPTSSTPRNPATATPDVEREARVPIIKTASLTAAATKSAATKLAAATKRAEPPALKPKAPPTAVPVARPASPANAANAASPAKSADKPADSKPAAEGLAGWTSARATAAAAPKPKSPAPPAAAAAAPKAPAAKPVPTPAAGAAAAPASASAPASAPMDRDFIARNQVVERYLSGRLPLRGATEFEQFVSKHPEILDEIGLPERVNAGLRLLEASGKPEPWQEAPRPVWQKPQVTIALAVATGVLVVALMVLTGTNASRGHRIEQLQKQVKDQPLDPATSTREIRLMPSRSGASNAPAITIGAGGAQLADLKIDESRSPYHIFRITIDRIDQGRVGVISNLVKDSNGHLRIALNSTALGPGNYQLSIEGLNWRGDPEPDSWVTIGIQR